MAVVSSRGHILTSSFLGISLLVVAHSSWGPPRWFEIRSIARTLVRLLLLNDESAAVCG